MRCARRASTTATWSLVDRAHRRPATGRWSSPFCTTSSSAGACGARASECGLQAADARLADIVAGEGDALDIWGVVTHVIKPLPV